MQRKSIKLKNFSPIIKFLKKFNLKSFVNKKKIRSYINFFELNYLLKKICKLKLLEKNGLLIIHRHKKVEDKFPEEYKVIKEKNYGISKIIFLI